MNNTNLQLSNILMGILNDQFRAIENLKLNSQNYITFKAVKGKSKSFAEYIIVSNQLIKINSSVRSYKYLCNGQTTQGCKNILELPIDTNIFKYDFIKHFGDN